MKGEKKKSKTKHEQHAIKEGQTASEIEQHVRVRVRGGLFFIYKTIKEITFLNVKNETKSSGRMCGCIAINYCYIRKKQLSFVIDKNVCSSVNRKSNVVIFVLFFRFRNNLSLLFAG